MHQHEAGRGTISKIVGVLTGNSFTLTVPAGYTARLVSLLATFTATAAAGNRTFALAFTVDGDRVFRTAITANHATATTLTYCAGPVGWSGAQLALNALLPTPEDFTLPQGATITPELYGSDAGDRWSGVVALVELFPAI